MTLEQLIESLTLDQAREYESQIDKLVWVQYNLLDPNDLSRRHTEAVEDALDAILADNALQQHWMHGAKEMSPMVAEQVLDLIERSQQATLNALSIEYGLCTPQDDAQTVCSRLERMAQRVLQETGSHS